jgi:hypothetical protein
MPTLTRRRSNDHHDCWHVYFGDVRVGTCGFYPGSHPGECTQGTAATLDQARAGFEAAWRVFLAKRTEADFQAWRDQQAWTQRKYAM